MLVRRLKTDSLVETNQIVTLNESGVGPLTPTGMKTVGDENEFEFDETLPLPSKTAIVVKDSDPQPQNSTKVCSGTIWVSSVQTACTAWRPN
jgi:hypothetical protein